MSNRDGDSLSLREKLELDALRSGLEIYKQDLESHERGANRARAAIQWREERIKALVDKAGGAGKESGR